MGPLRPILCLSQAISQFNKRQNLRLYTHTLPMAEAAIEGVKIAIELLQNTFKDKVLVDHGWHQLVRAEGEVSFMCAQPAEMMETRLTDPANVGEENTSPPSRGRSLAVQKPEA